MTERHWIIACNEQTEICRFMLWAEEWLAFKYDGDQDIQPDWQQLGFYETQKDAFMGFLSMAEEGSVGRTT